MKDNCNNSIIQRKYNYRIELLPTTDGKANIIEAEVCCENKFFDGEVPSTDIPIFTYLVKWE